MYWNLLGFVCFCLSFSLRSSFQAKSLRSCPLLGLGYTGGGVRINDEPPGAARAFELTLQGSEGCSMDLKRKMLSGSQGEDRHPVQGREPLSAAVSAEVLCGRVRELSSAPSQEQKEELTAKCLGPGGVFGAKPLGLEVRRNVGRRSEVHSIHGGQFCYVCAHNHQVYPEVVMFIS